MSGIAEYNQPASIIGNVSISAPNVGDNHVPTLGDFGALQMGYDGTANWERIRNNAEFTLLASGVRNANAISAFQPNVNSKGLHLILSVTNASGTGGLIVAIQGIDPTSGNPYGLNTALAAIIANGTYTYELYPSSSGTGFSQKISGVLPRTFRVLITHGDGSNYTYSLGCSMIL